jgi:preprotein translocase subunit SecF
MSRMGSMGARLYRGEVSYDFVGRRRRWYAISAVFLLVSIAALLVSRLTLGIEFRGGAEFRVASSDATETAVLEVLEGAGIDGEIRVQQVGNDTVRVQTEKLTPEESQEIAEALSERFDVPRDDVSSQLIGPSWGEDISQKALRALAIFLVLVVLFLSFYFEWKMALAAMLALLHDLAITVGVYALVGFEVTPATVIGFLTILGYSLYDTVVVFDKVKENTQGLAGGSRMTYSGAANLAVNQTIVRSINTSVVALLPIGAILFAGVVLLGAGPLKDLALALFVGVAAGTYSSIFIATPLLAQLKEREPAMQALARRVAARGGGAAVAGQRKGSSRKAAVGAAGSGATAIDTDDSAYDAEPEPATAGAAARGGARPTDRRPGTGGGRNQPKRKNKSRPGGKKRR